MAEHTILSHDEFLDEAALVVVYGGDPDTVRRVEAHTASCPDCARELEGYREVAALLGAAVPQVGPPPELRARLLEAVRRTDQVSPATPSASRTRWAMRRPRFSAAWLAATASLVVSLAAISWVVSLQMQIVALREESQVARERATRYERIVRVLSSDGLAVRTLQPVGSMPSRGTVYLDPASETGMVMCKDLPPVEQGHAYQVWFVRGNERISGGMLWPDHGGNGYAIIKVPRDLQSFDSIGLTDEPGSGSVGPTTPRVIGTALSATNQ